MNHLYCRNKDKKEYKYIFLFFDFFHWVDSSLDVHYVLYYTTEHYCNNPYCPSAEYLSSPDPSSSSRYTQKNFGTPRSIFVCCTEDIYKFVSCTDPFESSPCGTRSDSTVTGKYLFVTRRLRHFERGGGGSSDFEIWNIFYFLSPIKIIKMKLNGL